MTRSILPTRSRTSTFRVPIRQPEKWKVESIAAFKKRQIEKNRLAENGANSSRKLDQKNISESATKRSPASIQRSAMAIEHIKRELEILHSNSMVIRNKMQALNAVRTSLLWLLKKSSALERSLIN